MHATQHPTTVAEPTPAETLYQAAEYLDRHGWIQKRHYERFDAATPPACALGALAIVSYGYPYDDPFCDTFTDDAQVNSWHRFVTAEFALVTFLGLKYLNDPALPGSVQDWNDEASRTAAEVIASLRTAAALYPYDFAPDADGEVRS